MTTDWTYQEWEDAIMGMSNLTAFDAFDLQEFVIQRWNSGDRARTPEAEYALYVDGIVAQYYE